VQHQPVLYHEIIHALQPKSGGHYVDGTVGAGGHAFGILEASAPNGRLLGLDLDPQALELARKRLSSFRERITLVQASYTTLCWQLHQLGWLSVDGVILDLGVSSMQLDTPQRGFSFQHDDPLDMRFNPDNPISAAELVNQWTEDDLAKIIFQYGEESRARQIAHAIIQARPISSTYQLAEIIVRSVSGAGVYRRRKSGIHPATRTFQALRIAVNQELQAVEQVLPEAASALRPGGRLAVISFHSLEDRLVKQYFRRESRDCLCPPRQPVCTCGHRAILREIYRHPIRPADDEIRENPRARSARLRVAEKIGELA
jgi:16S rRNA (cytosine1402-N4)-methyltransferase